MSESEIEIEEEEEEMDAIESRDDIPDRDELVELRRDQGLTNEEIAEEHFDEFRPRQIGMFCQMYGIKKGWKDADYVQEQIDNGVTPEDLADQWPITEATVRAWMDRHDIVENPLPEAYNDAIEAIEELAEAVEEVGEDDLADEYEEIANTLAEDEQGIFQ